MTTSSLPPSVSSLPVSMSPSLSPSASNFSTSSVGVPSGLPDCSSSDTTLRLPLIVFYTFFFFLGLLGNLFALWVFLFLHSSRNSVRVFLINCAVADLVLLACLPFRVLYHVKGNTWPLGSLACKLVGNLFYMNMYISIMLLGLISLDRYLRLKGRSHARRRLTKLRLWGRSLPWSWMVCGALWGLSLVALVPMISTPEDRENQYQCFQYKKRNQAKGKAYFNAVLVAMFWLVFTMLVVSYMKIARRLLAVSRDKPDLPNAQKYQRTAKKSFFVLFLFTMCFGPYHAFRPVYILSQLSQTVACDYLQLMDRINEVTLLFSAFNSCLDPVMYFLLSGSVRNAALQALGHRFANRLHFLHDATSISSTTEFRGPSAPVALPNSELNAAAVTPKNSVFVINAPLTTLPPAGQI